MNVVRGTWIDGRIVLDAPAEWPDGSRVEVVLSRTDPEPLGMRDEDWPTDLAGIEQLLARMDEGVPLEMTSKEEDDLNAWRQEVKKYTIAHMNGQIDGLFP